MRLSLSLQLPTWRHHPKDDITKVTHHDGHAYYTSKCYFECLNRKKAAEAAANGKEQHEHHEHNYEGIHTSKKVDHDHDKHHFGSDGQVNTRYNSATEEPLDITHHKFSQAKSFQII